VVTAWFDLRRDWVALTILALSIVMIGSGLTGHSRVFGYAVVLFIGVLAGLGFIRRRHRSTWWPPIVATLVLLLSLAGAFAGEAFPVDGAADTVLGFQAGTAFVVYGIWLPAFFTLGVTYVLVFDRLSDQSAVAADEKAAP
jgi:hypothetical protein